jgi:hypothetical protein
LTTDVAGFKAGGHPCAHLPFYPYLLPYVWTKKEKKDEKRIEQKKEKENRKRYQGLEGVELPSSLSHGGAGLDSIHHYTEPPAKTREPWVYVSGRV